MTSHDDKALTERLTFRATPAMRARWQQAADATGRTLAELFRAGADAEVEYSEQAVALRRKMNEGRAKG